MPLLPSSLVLTACVLICSFGLGGCVAAGLAAAGPVLSGLTAVGDRTVERTVASDRDTAWRAAVETLNRLAIRVQRAERAAEPWVLEGAGERLSVQIELSRLTGAMTRVSLRAEAGKLLADKRSADEILDQIATSVARLDARPLREISVNDTQGGILVELQDEIRRLRSRIEEGLIRKADTGSARNATAAAPGGEGTITISPSGRGVVSIPSTYGIPRTAGGGHSDGTSESSAPGRSTTRAPVVEESREPTSSVDAPVRGLAPVDVLRPAASLTAPPPK